MWHVARGMLPLGQVTGAGQVDSHCALLLDTCPLCPVACLQAGRQTGRQAASQPAAPWEPVLCWLITRPCRPPDPAPPCYPTKG